MPASLGLTLKFLPGSSIVWGGVGVGGYPVLRLPSLAVVLLVSLTRSHPKRSACPRKWEGGREHPVLCFGGGVGGGGLPSSLLGGGAGPSSLLGVAGYPVLCQHSLAVNMPESLALTLNLHVLGRPDGWVVPSSSLGGGGVPSSSLGVGVPSSSLGKGGYPVLRWGRVVPSSSLWGVVGVVPSSSLGAGGVPISSLGKGGTQFFAGEGGEYPVLRG